MSNLQITIISLLLLFNQINADETPGIKLYSKVEAVQEVAELYLPGILSMLEGMKIPLNLILSDSSKSGNAGAFASYINATFIGIDTVNLADNEGQIAFSDNGDISVTLEEFNLGIDLGYDITNILFSDVGDIKLSTRINNIYTVLNLSTEKNVLQLQIKNLTFEMRGTQFKFNSTYWVFIVLNQIEGLISTLTADVLTLLVPYVKNYLANAINSELENSSELFRAFPLLSSGVTVDLGLYELNVNSKFAEISLNGTFMDLKNPGRHCPSELFPLPSEYLTTDASTIKLQLSDYVLDSLVYVLYDNGLMAFAFDGKDLPASITQLIQLTTTFLNSMIPGIATVFGNHNATLAMNVTEYFSFQLDPANNWIFIQPKGYIDFLVDDYDPKGLALRMNFESDIKLGVKFVVDNGQVKLKANITEFTLTSISAAYVHEGVTFTGSTLQFQLNALLNLVKGLVNNLEIPLPLPEWLAINDLELVIGQHVLELGLGPKADSVKILVKELIAKLFN